MSEETHSSTMIKVHSSSSQGSTGNAPTIEKFQIKSELLSLLETVGAKGDRFLISEAMNYLREYIKTNRLYDPSNPMVINAEHNALGKVFDRGQFNIPWAMKKLYSFLLPISKDNTNFSSEDKNSQVNDENSLKRKNSTDSTNNSPKRMCPYSPPQFYYPKPPSYNSDPETVLSYQGYETNYVKDSTDWSLTDEDACSNLQSSGEGSIYFVDEDQFDDESYSHMLSSPELEYEVMTPPMDDDETDTGSVHNVIAEIIVHDVETDLEFWADSSNCGDEESSDPDITDGDKWQCKHCNSLNNPTIRYCERCYQLRHNWLPEHRRAPKRLRRKRRRDEIFRKSNYRSSARLSDLTISNEEVTNDGENIEIEVKGILDENDGKVDPKEEVSVDQMAGTSQFSSNCTDNLCSLCYENPSDGCIVHGSTGHLLGCYSCLKKLKRSGQQCPLCRGPIQKVIRVFKGDSF